MNRSQKLPALSKRLINGLKQDWLQQSEWTTDNLTNNKTTVVTVTKDGSKLESSQPITDRRQITLQLIHYSGQSELSQIQFLELPARLCLEAGGAIFASTKVSSLILQLYPKLLRTIRSSHELLLAEREWKALAQPRFLTRTWNVRASQRDAETRVGSINISNPIKQV